MENACCFVPIKRVYNRCAAGEIAIDFGPPVGSETVFVAILLPVNYSV